jgi:hypothetical protein
MIGKNAETGGNLRRLRRAPGPSTVNPVKACTVGAALLFSLSQLAQSLQTSSKQSKPQAAKAAKPSPRRWEENARAAGGFDKNFRSSLAPADC